MPKEPSGPLGTLLNPLGTLRNPFGPFSYPKEAPGPFGNQLYYNRDRFGPLETFGPFRTLIDSRQPSI